MTKRRLLHRLALLPLATLLCALLVACASRGPRAAEPCIDDPAKALPAAPAAAETKTLKDTTKIAIGIIDKYHVSPAPHLALLQGAWRGATLAATRSGIQVDEVAPQT